MLATHRDQENRVHSHQVPTKQQPKTPGARYPKTPLAFRHDENTRTGGLGGKTGLGTVKTGGNENLLTKGAGKGPAMVTPMETRTRAPLGNKTTNAKAKVDQNARVKEIEPTQAKQPTLQKPKQKSAELAPAKLTILADAGNTSDDVEEPEYGPPRPAPRPYESDVLPEGGLSFEGLKRGFLKGFYEHFHNPVDDNGVSREEKRFREEMQAVLKLAEERNEREAADLNWNIGDLVETVPISRPKQSTDTLASSTLNKTVKKAVRTNPPTIASRRAASALANPSDLRRAPMPGPPCRNASVRRPLSALIPGIKASKPAPSRQPTPLGNTAGEAASRTTIGYNKGRTASSMIHSRAASQSNRAPSSIKPVVARDADRELTVTPARLRQAGPSQQTASEGTANPDFVSIFEDVEEDDLPAMRTPFLDWDEEDEEFELKLTI